MSRFVLRSAFCDYRTKVSFWMVQESSSSDVQIEKVSASPPAFKLPPLFSVTPNSSGKGGNVQKRNTLSHTNQIEIMSERKSVDQPLSNSHIDVPRQGSQYSVLLPIP